MELNDHDLSVEERQLAAELSGLTQDPSADRRALILAAVRNAPGPRREVVRRWRPAVAAAAALVLLAASSVGVVAASGDALPSSPNYSLRSFAERVRLTFANPAAREQLRIAFAQSHISQAQAVLRQGDRSDAKRLLHDSGEYLAETKQDIANLSSGEQGAVQNQVNQTEVQQSQAEGQLNQQGDQGQQGG
jgi:uncharacterized protein DUF5667